MTTDKRPERSAPVEAGLGFWAKYIAITLAGAFALSEAAAWLLTETTATGLLRTRFRQVALLPLRPSEPVVREALERFSRDWFLEVDRDLGWNVRPNLNNPQDRTNALSIRAEPGYEYSAVPAKRMTRLMTLGDSYVYCSEVGNHETWQRYLETLRDDIETINMGLPGAGTDQAFLRWRRDGKQFWSHIVILGIWPDNMLRNLAIVDYYRTMFGLPFTKPRLVLGESGPARFVNEPIMSREELASTLTDPDANPLLEYDFWFELRDTTDFWYRRVRVLQVIESVWRRYERKLTNKKLLLGEIPDATEVTVAIAKLFANEVRQAGSIPLVLMIPDRIRLDWKPLPVVKRLREEQIDVIDMGPSFGHEVMTKGPDGYYVGGIGHHTPYANRVFAQYLEAELHPWIQQAQSLPGPGLQHSHH